MATNKPFIIRVAIHSPLRQLFDYVIPKTILEISPNQQPTSGCRVLVPFGRRLVVVLIVTCPETTDYDENKLKSIENLLDKSPLIPQELFALFVWAAHYYQHPIGDALFNMLPVTLRKAKPLSEPSTKYWQLTAKGKGLGENSLNRAPSQKALIGHLLKHGRLSHDDLIRLFPRNILHTLAKKDLIKDSEDVKAKVAIKIVLKQVPLSLNTAQKIVFAKIRYDDFRCYLLNGVTGSGKTEIYLRAIEDVLRQGKQALVLIPEISLTPQTQKRFSDRFNVPIVTLHSGLSDKARLIAWTDAKAGRASIVLGTRSAIFTPLEQPGLIVVDEEHDQSYKQQEGFRYSARDLAVIRARKENIPIILGSATPSIESLNNCVTKRYEQLMLPQRAGEALQPQWSIIDLKNVNIEAGIASTTLLAISETISNGHQVLIFLNRRGFAPAIICHHCGWAADCHSCDTKLTVHRARNRLICHHCDYQQAIPKHCPNCMSHDLVPMGEGTEQSEDYLKRYFPDTNIMRVDRDSTRKKGAMQTVFNEVERGEPCILIGTQMLAKGHHFSNVTLVVVLDADSGLFSPDFRSQERLAQLLTQVAGRSGRGQLPGRVFIQTHQPEHPLLESLIHKGYNTLAIDLMTQRRQYELPPYRHLAVIRAESQWAKTAETFLHHARATAQKICPASESITYLGPLPAMLEKRAGRYRFVLQINVTQRSMLQNLLTQLNHVLESYKGSKKIRWSVDVDPQEI